jgi:hypothetical protein
MGSLWSAYCSTWGKLGKTEFSEEIIPEEEGGFKEHAEAFHLHCILLKDQRTEEICDSNVTAQ